MLNFIIQIVISLLLLNRAYGNCHYKDPSNIFSTVATCKSHYSAVLDKYGDYEGPIQFSRPSGYGTMTLSNGDQLYGYWTNGDLHKTYWFNIHMTIIYANKNKYSGCVFMNKLDQINHYSDHRKLGCYKGKMTYSNGDFYYGYWGYGDIKEGEGNMKYANGDTYEGPFKDDKMHGIGKMYSRESNSIYEGGFKYGMKDGKGIISVKDGWLLSSRYNVICAGDICKDIDSNKEF